MSTLTQPKTAELPEEIQPFLHVDFLGTGDPYGGIAFPDNPDFEIVDISERHFARALIRAGQKEKLDYDPHPINPSSDGAVGYGHFDRGTAVKLGIVRISSNLDNANKSVFTQTGKFPTEPSGVNFAPKIIRGGGARVEFDIYEGIIVPAIPGRNVLRYITRSSGMRGRPSKIQTDDRSNIQVGSTKYFRDAVTGHREMERIVGLEAYTPRQKTTSRSLSKRILDQFFK